MLELSRTQRLAQFPDCCLETPQRRDRHGYGRINLPFNGKRIAVSAHRVAYSLFVGPLPAGEPVRHRCGNPACCNPKHLVTGVTKAPPKPVAVPTSPVVRIPPWRQPSPSHDDHRRQLVEPKKGGA